MINTSRKMLENTLKTYKYIEEFKTGRAVGFPHCAGSGEEYF
jgi:hypothetical protein